MQMQCQLIHLSTEESITTTVIVSRPVEKQEVQPEIQMYASRAPMRVHLIGSMYCKCNAIVIDKFAVYCFPSDVECVTSMIMHIM